MIKIFCRTCGKQNIPGLFHQCIMEPAITASKEALAQPVPEGYALISIAMLRTWGVFEDVIEQCQYPAAPVQAGAQAQAQEQRKPTIDWVSVEDRLPEAGGYYLATVDTDEGQHVDVLMFDLKQRNWIHEFEPTFCHSYLFAPTHWANRPEAAHNIKEQP